MTFHFRSTTKQTQKNQHFRGQLRNIKSGNESWKMSLIRPTLHWDLALQYTLPPSWSFFLRRNVTWLYLYLIVSLQTCCLAFCTFFGSLDLICLQNSVIESLSLRESLHSYAMVAQCWKWAIGLEHACSWGLSQVRVSTENCSQFVRIV